MLFKQSFVAVEQNKGDKEVLVQVLEAVRLVMRIFFSLNWQVGGGSGASGASGARASGTSASGTSASGWKQQ